MMMYHQNIICRTIWNLDSRHICNYTLVCIMKKPYEANLELQFERTWHGV